jgi:hypothetical protein
MNVMLLVNYEGHLIIPYVLEMLKRSRSTVSVDCYYLKNPDEKAETILEHIEGDAKIKFTLIEMSCHNLDDLMKRNDGYDMAVVNSTLLKSFRNVYERFTREEFFLVIPDGTNHIRWESLVIPVELKLLSENLVNKIKFIIDKLQVDLEFIHVLQSPQEISQFLAYQRKRGKTLLDQIGNEFEQEKTRYFLLSSGESSRRLLPLLEARENSLMAIIRAGNGSSDYLVKEYLDSAEDPALPCIILNELAQ